MPRNSRKSPGSWGTVEQLPSGRYRAFYRRDGGKFSAPETFATKDDGHAWLATERTDRTRGIWKDPRAGRITLAEYSATWMDARPELSPRTRDLYQRSLDRWVLARIANGRGGGVELGKVSIGDLTPAVVRTWYATVFAAARVSAERWQFGAAERAAHPARAWAIARGDRVAQSGRLSPHVLDAWRAAGEPRPKPVERVAPIDAGRAATAQAYRVLRAIMTTAVQDGLVLVNPCQLPSAGVVHHRERSTATPEEVAQLAAAVPSDFAAAVLLAAWSGLRYGELFALARRHVDLDAGTVRVERALVCLPGQPITFGKTKTARSNRRVHLPAFVVDVLRQHMAEHVPAGGDALLFTAKSGQPVSNLRVSFLFRRARQSIGRDDLTWHDLRHTGATLAYRAGASLPDVQARLGHSTARAAMIYAHTAEESDQAVATRMDELFAPLPLSGSR